MCLYGRFRAPNSNGKHGTHAYPNRGHDDQIRVNFVGVVDNGVDDGARSVLDGRPVAAEIDPPSHAQQPDFQRALQSESNRFDEASRGKGRDRRIDGDQRAL